MVLVLSMHRAGSPGGGYCTSAFSGVGSVRVLFCTLHFDPAPLPSSFLSLPLLSSAHISTPLLSTLSPFLLPLLCSRLLKTAGRTVELLRSLDSGTSLDHLPAHLLLLCHHLIYYASHGGSAELTSRSSLEQAQEAAKEAAGEGGGLTVQDYLHTVEPLYGRHSE